MIKIHWKGCKGNRFLFTFATNKPNMSLNDKGARLKTQKSLRVTPLILSHDRCSIRSNGHITICAFLFLQSF